ncbi:MAG: conjugal transfer protein TrbJ [Fusobacterium gastrosuis]|uniref:conjugal transfer protein TrbJ n=1 Tax=Fusobacterium gastrosuis TaxID=1755100 RepID=UPI002970329E|nr:conjugal transfer protein TrbJ [Fusobacteriaceae bacterium]MDY4011015.1 conjugal transfer protein TrbJ [Fusobacterium gastrosuis]MDY5713533.1 conjugal transfer protein TrbJ [Fusobacterium gastrosuis]
MKKKVILSFLLLSLIASAGPFGGRGGSSALKRIVTILVAMQAKQALMQTDLGKELFENIQQTQNQLKQIEMEMTNMLSLTQELTTGQLMKLQQDYQELIAIQNSFKDSINSFKNFEKAFKDTYTDFKNLEGLSADEYISKADNLLEATKKMTHDSFAMIGLGSPEKMANDAQRITALMKAANSAEGQKAVLQAGVNMAGEQTRILGELRTLLASSLQTQNAEEMRKLQEEKMALEHEKRVMNYEPSKNYKKPDLLNGFKW